MLTDDRKLLILTHRGDDFAARELWTRRSGLLLSYAASIVPSGRDDIVQRVFCRILELPAAELARVADVDAWLLTLVRREALNWLRSERRERERRGSRPPVPAVEAAPHADPTLAAAMASLPRVLREVVQLRHVSKLSFEQIAMVLSANRNTIAWRYRRAIEDLRAALTGIQSSNPPSAPPPSEVCHA